MTGLFGSLNQSKTELAFESEQEQAYHTDSFKTPTTRQDSPGTWQDHTLEPWCFRLQKKTAMCLFELFELHKSCFSDDHRTWKARTRTLADKTLQTHDKTTLPSQPWSPQTREHTTFLKGQRGLQKMDGDSLNWQSKGFSVSRFLSFLVSCFLGSQVSKIQSSNVSQFQRFNKSKIV